MIPTIVYLICLIWIPITFKKTGIRYAAEGRLQGTVLILLAMTLRWMLLLNLLVFWFDEWQTVWTALTLVGLTANMFLERKYLLVDLSAFKARAK